MQDWDQRSGCERNECKGLPLGIQVQGSVGAVRDVLRARSDYGAALLAQLTHSHPAGGNAEESKGAAAFMQKFMAMSMDEKAAQLISRCVLPLPLAVLDCVCAT